MTFQDLPEDWPTRPLTDPALVADVLDLVVSERDRAAGAIILLVCDGDDRLAQPFSVSAIHDAQTMADRRATFEPFVEVLRQLEGSSILVAIARQGPLLPTDDDRAWHQAAVDACRGRVRLLGTHVVTPAGARELPDYAGPVAS